MQLNRSLVFLTSLVAALFLVVAVGGEVLAQGFAAPSGCRTTTLKNTLLFTQSRTGNPGDKNVVIGAYTVEDDDPTVADTGVTASANCQDPTSPSDGNPTHVTVIAVTLAGGDLISADIQAVRLFLDGNEDGFFQAGQDTQLGSDLAGTCLFSQCLFSFGRTTPLFNVNSDGFEDVTRSFIITVDLGPNTRAGANLMINVTAEANDIVTLGPNAPSSDFNDTFRSQTSNIVLNAPTGFNQTPIVQGINNGSGSPETGVRSVEVSGLLSRFRDERIVAGTREAVAAILYVCEGGTPVTPNVVILPAVAAAAPTIAGYPGALACVTSSNPDNFGTRILRARVAISGNAGAVGSLRLWDDANDNGVLFEGGEFVLSANPIGGVAIFGSLNNPLLASTRPDADPAPGHYAPQTAPITNCTSSAAAPEPRGSSQGCPHVLVITFDVNSGAQTGEVIFDVVLDVGNLPIEKATDDLTASSNQISTAPARTRVMVTGGLAPVQKTLAKRVAENSGNPNLIEDSDILFAMGKWARNEVLDGHQITDNNILELIRLWADNATVTQGKLRPLARTTRAKPASIRHATDLTSVAPGGSFLVTTTIDAGKGLNGLMLSQNLPAGWTVTPVHHAGALLKGSTWLWLNLAGKTTVTYKVTVPANAPNGTYTIHGQLKAAVPAYQASAGGFTVSVVGAPVELVVHAITLRGGDFLVEGAGISGTSIEVYRLNGARVFAGSAHGGRVAFSNANRLANGVYFYVARVEGADGNAVTKFGKLVVRH